MTEADGAEGADETYSLRSQAWGLGLLSLLGWLVFCVRLGGDSRWDAGTGAALAVGVVAGVGAAVCAVAVQVKAMEARMVRLLTERAERQG